MSKNEKVIHIVLVLSIYFILSVSFCHIINNISKNDHAI